jgi:hypothetical protein
LEVWQIGPRHGVYARVNIGYPNAARAAASMAAVSASFAVRLNDSAAWYQRTEPDALLRSRRERRCEVVDQVKHQRARLD